MTHFELLIHLLGVILTLASCAEILLPFLLQVECDVLFGYVQYFSFFLFWIIFVSIPVNSSVANSLNLLLLLFFRILVNSFTITISSHREKCQGN